MTIRNTLIQGRDILFYIVRDTYEDIARYLGYPDKPGMPIVPPNGYFGESFFQVVPLPVRQVPMPNTPPPQNYIEIFLGTFPKINPIERVFFVTPEEGFYNFFIQNFRNASYLPNWLSKFLQIYFNCCLDISFLEVFREVLFILIFIYIELMQIRLLLGWLISINPYSFPLNYFVSFFDWIEEAPIFSSLPSIAGMNLTNFVFMIILGKFSDNLNHLVFTMPFLPSEGEPMKIQLNDTVTDVLVYRFLPRLWFYYPIPNDLREFWYTQRPDILKYMQKAYPDLGVEFRPDRIVEAQGVDIAYVKDHLTDLASSNVISTTSLMHINEFSNYLIHIPENLLTFFTF